LKKTGQVRQKAGRQRRGVGYRGVDQGKEKEPEKKGRRARSRAYCKGGVCVGNIGLFFKD